MQLTAFLSALSALSAGEYSRKSTQSIYKESPMSLADLRRRTPKTTLTTNCLSLRNNAALLHSSALSALSAGEYSRKSTQAIYKESPMSLADLADSRRYFFFAYSCSSC